MSCEWGQTSSEHMKHHGRLPPSGARAEPYLLLLLLPPTLSPPPPPVLALIPALRPAALAPRAAALVGPCLGLRIYSLGC